VTVIVAAAVVVVGRGVHLEWRCRYNVQVEVVVGWSHTHPRQVCNSGDRVAAGVGESEVAMRTRRDNNQPLCLGAWEAANELPDQCCYNSRNCRPADVVCIGSFVGNELERCKGRLGHMGCMWKGRGRVKLPCDLSGVEGHCEKD